MKNIRTFLLLAIALLISAPLLGADAPPERAAAVAVLSDFIKNSWPVLAVALISEIMPFLPTKANGILELIKLWISKSKP